MKTKMITLHNEKWKASVLPAWGANLIALSYCGEPILRTPPSLSLLDSDSPYLYGNPLLLPPNRTRDGKFTFEGQAYQLPINELEHRNHLHGQLYNAPFDVVEVGQFDLCCRYQNKGERFPFPFTIALHYQLGSDGLLLKIELHNDGECPMPVALGFHTTFVEPEFASVPIGSHWERDDRLLPTGRLLPLIQQQTQLRSGFCSRGLSIAGYYTASGHTAYIGKFGLETSTEFNQWVLYNGGGGKGFLCVEPQLCTVDGLNLQGGCRRLEAQQAERYWLRFFAAALKSHDSLEEGR